MKASSKDFAALAPRLAREARIFFLCGPDEAGIHEAAATIVGLLPNAGERVELSGADLRRDPVLLGDEARSVSLFGDTRHLWVRASGDELADSVANLLAAGVEPCPVLILAPNATDKTRIAKLLEPRGDAVVATFWPPDLKSVAGAVRRMADAAGLRLGGDLAERIARGAALDTRLAQTEITKLALYLDASPERPRGVEAEAIDAIGAQCEDDGIGRVVNTVMGGETGRLAGELARMREHGINPVTMLLACERRAAQLAALAARLGPRGDVRALLAAERAAKRVFWKDERDLAAQLQRWRGRRLERLVDRLMQLHRALLANSHCAELLLSQGLTEITRAAQR